MKKGLISMAVMMLLLLAACTQNNKGEEVEMSQYKDQGFVILGFPCDQLNTRNLAPTKKSLSSAASTMASHSR